MSAIQEVKYNNQFVLEITETVWQSGWIWEIKNRNYYISPYYNACEGYTTKAGAKRGARRAAKRFGIKLEESK